jgi:hypothetical protein
MDACGSAWKAITHPTLIALGPDRQNLIKRGTRYAATSVRVLEIVLVSTAESLA